MNQELIPIVEALKALSPRVQRNIDRNHVEDLYAMQLEDIKQWKTTTLLQSLTFAQLNGRNYIVDGQHRLAVFRKLLDNPETTDIIRAQHVHVITYQMESEGELNNLYRKISKEHKPVHPLEISDQWFLMKDFDKYFYTNYSAFLSHSERCRFPNIYERKLKDKMEVLSKLDIDANSELLIACTKRLNERAKELLQPNELEQIKKKGSFYLGHFRNFEWIDLIRLVLKDAKTIPEVETAVNALIIDEVNNKNKKAIITKTVRKAVWKRDNTVNGVELAAGRCYCCKGNLHINDMQCGHIKPRCQGGDTSINNLRAICHDCNRDMGIMNLEDYKEILERQV